MIRSPSWHVYIPKGDLTVIIVRCLGFCGELKPHYIRGMTKINIKKDIKKQNYFSNELMNIFCYIRQRHPYEGNSPI